MIIGYKAFEHDMKCRDKQYKEHTIYEEHPHGKYPELCSKGSMHFCYNPTNILKYYNIIDHQCNPIVVASVSPIGMVDSDGLKACTDKLEVLDKIPLKTYIQLCCSVKWKSFNRDSEHIYTGKCGGNISTDISNGYIISNNSNCAIALTGINNNVLSSGDNTTIAILSNRNFIYSIGSLSDIYITKGGNFVYVGGNHSNVIANCKNSKIYLNVALCTCYVRTCNYIKGCSGSVFYIKNMNGDMRKVIVGECDSEMKPGVMYYINDSGELLLA